MGSIRSDRRWGSCCFTARQPHRSLSSRVSTSKARFTDHGANGIHPCSNKRGQLHLVRYALSHGFENATGMFTMCRSSINAAAASRPVLTPSITVDRFLIFLSPARTQTYRAVMAAKFEQVHFPAPLENFPRFTDATQSCRGPVRLTIPLTNPLVVSIIVKGNACRAKYFW